ncbi:hypothetical protein ACFL6W_03545 [Thermodesulfobacteriota bacterium]
MINPNFTRGEYWLLETVAEIKFPIRLLDDRESLEIELNKPSHGMNRNLLIDTIQKLFSNGLITAFRIGDTANDFIFSKEQLEAAFNERKLKKGDYYYGLTKKGGQYWEAFASPNWDYYIDVGYIPIENGNYDDGELICSVKSNLEKYFKSVCYHEYDVDEKSIQWDTVEPWEATYWKELPMGYRVRFHGKMKESYLNSSVPLYPYWYHDRWYSWQ